jgi:hypothetical protein
MIVPSGRGYAVYDFFWTWTWWSESGGISLCNIRLRWLGYLFHDETTVLVLMAVRQLIRIPYLCICRLLLMSMTYVYFGSPSRNSSSPFMWFPGSLQAAPRWAHRCVVSFRSSAFSSRRPSTPRLVVRNYALPPARG